jgi:hypothetical protein
MTHLNLVTFLVFRGVPITLIWVGFYRHRHVCSWFYVALLGTVMFFMTILNSVLFWRLLRSDILRPRRGREGEKKKVEEKLDETESRVDDQVKTQLINGHGNTEKKVS